MEAPCVGGLTWRATARDQPGGRAVEADAALSWGDGLALTADRDVLAHEAEPSRAPNHLPSRHDDGTATAELHEVDLLLAGTEELHSRFGKEGRMAPAQFGGARRKGMEH